MYKNTARIGIGILIVLHLILGAGCTKYLKETSTTSQPTKNTRSSLQGTIYTTRNQPITNHAIELYQLQDTSHIKISSTTSNSNGFFQFNNVEQGAYYLSIQYTNAYTALFNVDVKDGVLNNTGILKILDLGHISGKIELEPLATNNTLSNPLLGIDVFIPGTSHIAKTNRNGYFELNEIPSGNYTVVISKENYNTLVTENIKVNIHETTEINTLTLTTISIEQPSHSVISPTHNTPQGYKWLTGTSPPTQNKTISPINGDYYLESNGALYQFNDNHWITLNSNLNGQDGQDGLNGQNGQDGQDGLDGHKWYTGEIAPTQNNTITPNNGDYYLQSNGNIYRFETNSWTELNFGLKGQDGLPYLSEITLNSLTINQYKTSVEFSLSNAYKQPAYYNLYYTYTPINTSTKQAWNKTTNIPIQSLTEIDINGVPTKNTFYIRVAPLDNNGNEGLLSNSITINTTALQSKSTPSYNTVFGSLGNNDGQFEEPISMIHDNSNLIYIADVSQNRIQVFNTAGELQAKFNTLNKPADIAYFNEKIYVADKGLNNITAYNKNGTIDTVLINNLQTPTQLTLDTQGNIIVYEEGSQKVSKYTVSGDLEATIISDIKVGDLCINSENKLHVLDQTNRNIKVYDSALTLEKELSDEALVSPNAIVIDSLNNIIVSDSLSNQCIIFREDNSIDIRFGQTGNNALEFNTVTSLISIGNILYVLDSNNYRIQNITLETSYFPIDNVY